jgi:hypothetical protein
VTVGKQRSNYPGVVGQKLTTGQLSSGQRCTYGRVNLYRAVLYSECSIVLICSVRSGKSHLLFAVCCHHFRSLRLSRKAHHTNLILQKINKISRQNIALSGHFMQPLAPRYAEKKTGIQWEKLKCNVRQKDTVKKDKKETSHAPYWNRTSDLIITSDTLYHLANGAC